MKYLHEEVGVATAHGSVFWIGPLIGTTTLGVIVAVHLAAAALGYGRVVVLGVRGVVHARCQRRQQVDNGGGPESYSCAHWPIYVTAELFVRSLANLCDRRVIRALIGQY